MDDDFLIYCVEHEEENSFFDFKRDIYDFSNLKEKQDFLIDVLSFANCHQSGNKYIITGVKLYRDKPRDFFGVSVDKIKDGADYQSLINDNIEPKIIVDFKVLDYKGNKYGIFKIVETNVDKPYILSKQYGDLKKGTIKIRIGQKNEYVSRRDLDMFYKEKVKSESSYIKVKGIINKKENDNFELHKFDREFNDENAKIMIDDIIDKIKKIVIEKSELSFGTKLEMTAEEKKLIKRYADENKIELTENFFDIGNLHFFSIGLGYSGTYYGTATEREKYNLLSELSKTIAIYKGIKKFNNNINNLYYVELAIENCGKKFDEDIEVTLKVPKSKFLNFVKFPVPSEAIIEKIIEDNMIDNFLKIEKIIGANLPSCKSKIESPALPTSHMISPMKVLEPTYDDYMEYFYDYIKSVSNYNVIDAEDFCYIKFEQTKIKPNEIVLFPSRLLFTEKLDSIDYEIKSKHNSNVLIGTIYNNKNEV